MHGKKIERGVSSTPANPTIVAQEPTGTEDYFKSKDVLVIRQKPNYNYGMRTQEKSPEGKDKQVKPEALKVSRNACKRIIEKFNREHDGQLEYDIIGREQNKRLNEKKDIEVKQQSLILGDQRVQVFASRRKVDQAVGDQTFGTKPSGGRGIFGNTLTSFVEEKDDSEEYSDDDEDQGNSVNITAHE